MELKIKWYLWIPIIGLVIELSNTLMGKYKFISMDLYFDNVYCGWIAYQTAITTIMLTLI